MNQYSTANKKALLKRLNNIRTQCVNSDKPENILNAFENFNAAMLNLINSRNKSTETEKVKQKLTTLTILSSQMFSDFCVSFLINYDYIKDYIMNNTTTANSKEVYVAPFQAEPEEKYNMVKFNNHCCNCCCTPCCCKPQKDSFFVPYSSGDTAMVLPFNVTDVTAIGDPFIVNDASFTQFVKPGVGTTIDIGILPINRAFILPKDSKITDLAAFTGIFTAVNVGAATVTVSAQIYVAPPNSNVFLPVPQAKIDFPFTGNVAQGTLVSDALNNINVYVPKLSRIMLVYYVSADQDPTIDFLQVTASGGLRLKIV